MKKYMLSEEMKKVVTGDKKITLHRIIATRKFANVNIGDKGGWVESERNLSHDGLSWIYDDSAVFSDAVVSENAVVQLNSTVSGQANIAGNTIVSLGSNVSGSVVISGDSYLTDYAIVTGNLVIDDSVITGSKEIGGAGNIKGVVMRLAI